MPWCPVHQVSDCEHIHLTKSKLNKKRQAAKSLDYNDYVELLAKKVADNAIPPLPALEEEDPGAWAAFEE